MVSYLVSETGFTANDPEELGAVLHCQINGFDQIDRSRQRPKIINLPLIAQVHKGFRKSGYFFNYRSGMQCREPELKIFVQIP
jgi:hypothetical protein